MTPCLTPAQTLASIAVMAAVTFLTRAAPFAFPGTGSPSYA